MAVELQETSRINALFERISALIEQARKRVVTAANIAEVYTKYNIGHYIVEEEQQGKSRAEYGQFVLKKLSEKLSERYGKGWGTENLRLIRSFYLVYSHKIQNSVLEIGKENQNVVLEFNTSENEQNTNWISANFSSSCSKWARVSCLRLARNASLLTNRTFMLIWCFITVCCSVMC